MFTKEKKDDALLGVLRNKRTWLIWTGEQRKNDKTF